MNECNNVKKKIGKSLLLQRVQSTLQLSRHTASTSTHDILHSVLHCHSNETHAPIADVPNRAQLEDTLPFPSYIRVRAVVWECGEGQTVTQTAVTTIRFASAKPHAKCNQAKLCQAPCLVLHSD